MSLDDSNDIPKPSFDQDEFVEGLMHPSLGHSDEDGNYLNETLRREDAINKLSSVFTKVYLNKLDDDHQAKAVSTLVNHFPEYADELRSLTEEKKPLLVPYFDKAQQEKDLKGRTNE